MRILAIDISGKVEMYDRALYESVQSYLSVKDQSCFACPYFTIGDNHSRLRLWSFIPKRYRNSANLVKRTLKFIEGVINYVVVLTKIKNYDVLHLQWLPFLEVCSLERHVLKLARKRNPDLKIVLTIHNIYPHNSNQPKQIRYRKRIQTILPLIDHVIVHTNSSKDLVCSEFGIQADKVAVIHHGIFVPSYIPQLQRKEDGKVRILQFGQQSAYKGTDILINAIELLDPVTLSQIEVHIIGSTNKNLYATYSAKTQVLPIVWTNNYMSDQDLYQEIQEADLLTYPYRAISQSGALLLGLYFKKPVIISDLPSFVETLGQDYPHELICKAGDAQSLADSIRWSVANLSNMQHVQKTIQHIIDTNSWESAANKTIQLYHQLVH